MWSRQIVFVSIIIYSIRIIYVHSRYVQYPTFINHHISIRPTFGYLWNPILGSIQKLNYRNYTIFPTNIFQNNHQCSLVYYYLNPLYLMIISDQLSKFYKRYHNKLHNHSNPFISNLSSLDLPDTIQWL